jgi:hypothetical protein
VYAEDMTRPIVDLGHFVLSATLAYRKGVEFSEREVGNVKVFEINGYPETPSHGALVDVHFLSIGFTEKASITKAEFLSMVNKARDGEFQDLSLEDFAGGPSYLTIGGWLGSQDLALRFMALGQFLGVWMVITPERLGVTGTQADALAGGGMVMTSGVKY